MLSEGDESRGAGLAGGGDGDISIGGDEVRRAATVAVINGDSGSRNN